MEPELDPADFEKNLRTRARWQRRLLLLGTVWVISWAATFGNDLLRYNEWPGPIWMGAAWSLFLAPFSMAIAFLPAALLGRWISSIRKLRPYRDALILGLPLIVAVAIQVPTALDRLNPIRVFTRITEVEFPADGVLLDYRHLAGGMDSALKFEFRAPAAQLHELIERLGYVTEGPSATPSPSGPERFRPAVEEVSAHLELHVDWASETAIFVFTDY